MSDFLVKTGRECDSGRLLDLLRLPYDRSAPRGQGFDFSWGSVAVLEDHLTSNRNIVCKDKTVFAWVGELLGGNNGFSETLMTRLTELQHSRRQGGNNLDNDPVLAQLNGAFAVLLADETGFSIVVDPLGFTQVFLAEEGKDNVLAAGTHAETVAIAGDVSMDIDLISAVQFLRHGHLTFPNTMYKNVTECHAGSVHVMKHMHGDAVGSEQWSYWTPPPERQTKRNDTDLSDTLRDIFLTSLQDRCEGHKIGVALSGGLDSRLVAAAVPKDKTPIAFTMCDRLNREAHTARRVAEAYGWSWRPLFRDEEYLANQLVDTVRFVGCECEFVHAHVLGFAETIASEVDVLLTGDLLDTLLRAYTAEDFVYPSRLGAFLRRPHEKTTFDYLHWPHDLWDEHITPGALSDLAQRRREFYERSVASERTSAAEWLKVYPFRQWIEVAIWSAQRRRLPLRLVGADRRLLDFAFTCPMEQKLGSKIFLKTARQILGPGLSIPSANDGVRPCSGPLWRLLQRAVRKSEDGVTALLQRCGRKAPIQHSWHDYQAYWRNSKQLAQLRAEYGPRLEALDTTLFQGSGQALLNDTETFWRHGFRLLQLAVWLGTVAEYKAAYEHGRHWAHN